MCPNSHRRRLGIFLALAAYASCAAAQEAPAPAAVLAEPALVSAPMFAEPPIKSLFYSDEEMRGIRTAMISFITRDPMLNLSQGAVGQTADGEPRPKQNEAFVYPQFFLESIVYRSPKDWIIWLNGQKFTADNAKNDKDLVIRELDSKTAKVAWKPFSMDKVLEVWDRMPPPEGVEVDRRQGIVMFSLHPNQTFSSYVMRVLEGKVAPVTIKVRAKEEVLLDTTKSAPGNAEPGSEPLPDMPPLPSGMDNTTREGLKGLLDSYKNIHNEMKPQ